MVISLLAACSIASLHPQLCMWFPLTSVSVAEHIGTFRKGSNGHVQMKLFSKGKYTAFQKHALHAVK